MTVERRAKIVRDALKVVAEDLRRDGKTNRATIFDTAAGAPDEFLAKLGRLLKNG